MASVLRTDIYLVGFVAFVFLNPQSGTGGLVNFVFFSRPYGLIQATIDCSLFLVVCPDHWNYEQWRRAMI